MVIYRVNKKMGAEGIFAIVQKAHSLGINPLEALNGNMYFINGKVEMQAIMMAKLIRQAGHSFTPGKECSDEICVLHGKRKDNGDTWKVSFSIEEAKRAGIYRQGGPWSKYPEDMLYSRALSRLARRLFPDVIGNCYVQGEISDAAPLYDEVEATATSVELEKISSEEAAELTDLIGEDNEYRNKMMDFLEKRFQAKRLDDMPKLVYEQLKSRTIAHNESKELIEKEA